MKFFKYLILFFTLISTHVFSQTIKLYIVDNSFSNTKYKSASEACNAFASYKGISGTVTTEGSNLYCLGNSDQGYPAYKVRIYVSEEELKCEAGQKKFLDGYIGGPDSFAPSTVCFEGCVYNSDGGGTAFDTPNGNLSWGINAESTGETCPTDTPKGEDKPNTPPPMTPDECKNANGSDAYCNKPNDKKCPSGYKQGTFNNQQICIKPSPDPDPNKPNPNDPNNGKGEGNCNGTNNCNTTNFDDSRIVSAINASTSAITSAISSLSSALSSGFSSVVNAVSGVTSAVNANTSAVNANGDKVTNAVNENTSAVNAVKSAVNGLNSSIQAVTTAVNDNGNKVTNAVNQNTTATNAVKDAVNNLNNAVQAVTDAVNSNGVKVTDAVNTNGKNTVDAINTNGKNAVDAVNAGTEATKENGKKLDGIKDGVEEGNGLLKEIKDWLTGEPDLENQQLEINEEILPGYERKEYVQFTNNCPFSSEQVTLPMGVLPPITFTKDLTFICTYSVDARPYIIGLGYLGALIYLLYGIRSRNG